MTEAAREAGGQGGEYSGGSCVGGGGGGDTQIRHNINRGYRELLAGRAALHPLG